MGSPVVSNYPFACDPDVGDRAFVAHHDGGEDGFPDGVGARAA